MTHATKLTRTALGGALLAAGMTMPMAQAQTANSLLDKLVEKGVLTVKEANELRDQADADSSRAHEAKSDFPDWVKQLRFYGDVRGRYDTFHTPNDTSGTAGNKPRSRLRYRLRTGATATMLDHFEAGFRLTSGEADGAYGGDPISGNTTLQDNGSKKFVYIDLAYGKWTPIKSGPWLINATIGKIENPFAVSDMVFDGDYTPEGAAIEGAYTLNDVHSFKWSGAYFHLDEIIQGPGAGDDPFLWGLQARWDAKWTPHLATAAGLSFLGLSEKQNLGNGSVPNVNVGNTRDAAGNLTEDFAPVILDASLTYTFDRFPLNAGPVPLTFGGEFMHNTRAQENANGWWAGIFLGKAGRKGTWELSYRYKYLESDAWYEEFVDSDFGAYRAVGPANAGGGNGYRAGTGVKGHITKFVYSVSDSFSVGATWFYTSLIDEPSVPAAVDGDSTEHRIQFDALWKF
jgi:hypothetical protein